MKIPLLTFLLSTSLFVSSPTESAFSLFKKPSKNIDELRQQIKVEIKNLSTLREASRILRQMEAVYLQAKNTGLNPDYKKKIEDNLKKDFDLAQQNLKNLKTEWMNQRLQSLSNLKNKSTLKADQISQLKADLEQLENVLANLIKVLEALPPEGKILLLATWAFAIAPTLPQDNNAQQMFEGFKKLNNKIIQAQKQLLVINQGINRLDLVLQNVEIDPRFKRDHEIALSGLTETQRKLTNINDAYNDAMKPILNPLSQKSQELITLFQGKAKTLGCSSLTGIGEGQRGISQCREQSLKRISKAAKESKVKACLLTLQSDDPSIENCAKEVGLSYLNLGQK
jgi:hypothetical protein